MDEFRYALIDLSGEELSQDELERGWHFCPEWDGLLIGPGMQEMEACLCQQEKR